MLGTILVAGGALLAAVIGCAIAFPPAYWQRDQK
jgi:hypothetical protein